MAKKICEILWNSVMVLLLLCMSVQAQEKSAIYQVQITHDTSGLHVSLCPLPGISGDTWRFANSTSDTLYIFILMCVGKQDSPFFYLAAGDSVDHTIGMWDALVQVMILRTGEVVRCVREHPPACPTLTPWGATEVVGLIISSAIFIMLKRRKVKVSV